MVARRILPQLAFSSYSGEGGGTNGDVGVTDTTTAPWIRPSFVAGGDIVLLRPVFSADGNVLIYSSGCSLSVVEVATGAVLAEFHPQENSGVDVDPGSKSAPNQRSGCAAAPETIISFHAHQWSQDEVVLCTHRARILSWNYRKGTVVELADHSRWLRPNEESPPDKKVVHFEVAWSKTKYYLGFSLFEERSVEAVEVPFEVVNDGSQNKVIQKRIDSWPGSFQVSPNGEFAAFVSKNSLMLVNLADIQQKRRHIVADGLRLTALAIHPHLQIVATGDSQGRIIIWREVFQSNPVRQVIHWHSQACRALAFSDEGSHLYSGGEECVLVRWRIDDEFREFLPRLGSPIQHLVVAPGNVQTAVSLSDNVIQLVDAFKQLTVSLGSMRRPLVKDAQSFMLPDSIAGELLMSGRPGQLAWYDPYARTCKRKLDVTGRNLIMGDDPEKRVTATELGAVALSKDGQWLATFEKREDSHLSSELRLKIWQRQEDEFQCHTCVDYPHVNDTAISSLMFSPFVGPPYLLISLGVDGTLREWTTCQENEQGSADASNTLWECICEHDPFIAGSSLSSLSFSWDGSVLAGLTGTSSKSPDLVALMVFDDGVGQWSPDPVVLDSPETVRSVHLALEFLLVLRTESLDCYDLLCEDRSVLWTVAAPTLSHFIPTVIPSTAKNRKRRFTFLKTVAPELQEPGTQCPAVVFLDGGEATASKEQSTSLPLGVCFLSRRIGGSRSWDCLFLTSQQDILRISLTSSEGEAVDEPVSSLKVAESDLAVLDGGRKPESEAALASEIWERRRQRRKQKEEEGQDPDGKKGEARRLEESRQARAKEAEKVVEKIISASAYAAPSLVDAFARFASLSIAPKTRKPTKPTSVTAPENSSVQTDESDLQLSPKRRRKKHLYKWDLEPIQWW
ncbi:unnamed protein product [Cyprideis torosa]|uniref:WD repeat-containing protein 75 second beta-propeller domain-containing protein n=1 Tax=Cyprideis torosa TaxID=163714 RepID=A0A7R8WCS4_9CRUS|nr:unnamed protein product [Cyprideis torosa]CAG0892356.1 unnamed protein product [Cyprideis torosa]